LLLDAARSLFSGADMGVKTRKLVGRADNVRVIARGVESRQVVLTAWTLHSRLGLSVSGRERHVRRRSALTGARVHCNSIAFRSEIEALAKRGRGSAKGEVLKSKGASYDD
jgi:hypothetical protein